MVHNIWGRSSRYFNEFFGRLYIYATTYVYGTVTFYATVLFNAAVTFTALVSFAATATFATSVNTNTVLPYDDTATTIALYKDGVGSQLTARTIEIATYAKLTSILLGHSLATLNLNAPTINSSAATVTLFSTPTNVTVGSAAGTYTINHLLLSLPNSNRVTTKTDSVLFFGNRINTTSTSGAYVGAILGSQSSGTVGTNNLLFGQNLCFLCTD